MPTRCSSCLLNQPLANGGDGDHRRGSRGLAAVQRLHRPRERDREQQPHRRDRRQNAVDQQQGESQQHRPQETAVGERPVHGGSGVARPAGFGELNAA